MFNVYYIGDRYPAIMTKGKGYTVHWVDVKPNGKTYFLVADDYFDFVWIIKSEFCSVLPM